MHRKHRCRRALPTASVPASMPTRTAAGSQVTRASAATSGIFISSAAHFRSAATAVRDRSPRARPRQTAAACHPCVDRRVVRADRDAALADGLTQGRAVGTRTQRRIDERRGCRNSRCRPPTGAMMNRHGTADVSRPAAGLVAQRDTSRRRQARDVQAQAPVSPASCSAVEIATVSARPNRQTEAGATSPSCATPSREEVVILGLQMDRVAKVAAYCMARNRICVSRIGPWPARSKAGTRQTVHLGQFRPPAAASARRSGKTRARPSASLCRTRRSTRPGSSSGGSCPADRRRRSRRRRRRRQFRSRDCRARVRDRPSRGRRSSHSRR